MTDGQSVEISMKRMKQTQTQTFESESGETIWTDGQTGASMSIPSGQKTGVQHEVQDEVQPEVQAGVGDANDDADKVKAESGTAKTDRRHQILDAAEVVLQKRGFEKATMDEIAEQADVAKGTLYLYFKNKHAIYLSLSERGSMLLNAKLGAVLSRDQNGLALIRDLGKTYLRFIHEYPLYFTTFGYYERVLMHQGGENADLIERCEKQAEIALRTIVRALQIGMQDGSVNPEFDPEELGLTIWGASKGVIHMAYLKNKRSGTDAMITNFIRIIGSGIKNDEMDTK